MHPLPAQPKKVTFLKPDHYERVRQEKPKVLVVNGFQSEAWQLESAAKTFAGEVQLSQFQQASAIAPNLTYWPRDYQELMTYDTIVLADLDANAMSLFAQEMLRDYVRAGGGLLVLGGLNTLGNGSFAKARFADILPVEPGKAFEVRPLQVKTIELAAQAPFGLLQGKAVFFGNLLQPRPGAEVAARAGEWPLLVTGQAAKGRVAVLGATTLGTGGAGTKPLWKDAAWPEALAQILRWTSNR